VPNPACAEPDPSNVLGCEIPVKPGWYFDLLRTIR
jgi:hypothetical protein